MSAWKDSLLDPAKIIIAQIGQLLLNLLLVIFILILGWAISKLIKTFVIKLLKLVKLDELSEKIELSDILVKGGIHYSISELVGVICYWLAILVTVIVAINAVGLTIAADLLSRIVLYIPNVIGAIFILILGMFVARMLTNIIKTAAANIGLSQINLLSKVVEVTVMIFAIIIALQQLNIATTVVALAINIVLASLGLAVALAFGLGCKDIAGKYTAEFIDKLKSKK
ncbi:MAG: hypothetical protein V1674_06510 [Candidatus Omnitrophota bacterium]